jgi:Flp pilus assembly protein TadD
MNKLAILACTLAAFVQPANPNNVLLISVDTLRADRLSCYGYPNNRTPAIDRWAAEGIRFDAAFSEYPLTLPAHSTLLTGTYPSYHGVRENVGFALADNQLTLAELLKRNGYATAAFIGSYVLASQFGVSQGFAHFDESFGAPLEKVISASTLRRPAGQVTDRFLMWLEKHRSGRFFAFVHFYDPHAPCPNGYDAEVSRVDNNIRRIDETLRKWNLIDQTDIFLVSDHGEALGEHGESGHGFFLYDSTLRVPLIIRPATSRPGFSPKVPKTAVSLVDVMPTILQMAGVTSPAHLQGRSLLRAMQGKEARDASVYAETYIPELHFGWSPLRSLRLGKHKFIDAPRPELYDLDTDPAEKTNLALQNQALAGSLRAQLEKLAATRQARSVKRASGAVLEASEKLAALGYVQLGAMRVHSAFGRGIDPKDRIGAFENYHGVLNEIARGNVSEAILDRIGELRRQAPELRFLVFLEAQAFERLGRPQEALAKYRQGLAVQPENAVARAGLAGLMIRLGRMDDAEQELQRVLSIDPADYRSRNNLAGIYRSKGKPGPAMAELKKALETRPSYASGWHNLGQLYLLTKDLAGAEAALRKAVNLDPTDARAHHLLARVLKAAGKKVEADTHLRKALQLDPALSSRP